MAEDSIDPRQYKSAVRSDNDKGDLVTAKLERHAIALEVISRHPSVLNEYIAAVNGGAETC